MKASLCFILAATAVLLLQVALAAAESRPSSQKLSHLETWGYQLQRPDPATLAESAHQLLVIDPTRDGTGETAFGLEQIAKLRNAGKVVLAYVSIGEAEDYRFYWQRDWSRRPPEWLGPENPDWPGNFKVRYWDEDWWRAVVQPSLDRVLAAGFDGVYLDIIDAYWYWSEHGEDLTTAADRMVNLVERIASHSRVVVAQNGLSLIDDASPNAADRLLGVVDGWAEEDLFFNTDAEDRENRLAMAERAAASGSLLLSVEYVPAKRLVDYRRRVAERPEKWLLYRADPDRELDRLQPPVERSDPPVD